MTTGVQIQNHIRHTEPQISCRTPFKADGNLNMLQRYRVISKKGEGSFADVLTCENTRDGKLYAIKRLKRRFSSTTEVLNLAEIQALRRLTPHVNIVQLHDVIYDRNSGRLALVFELMEINMHEFLKARKRPLPEFRAKNYIYQLFKSLHHIHRHGIFHRDIKPENLLIKDNVLKLADFGSSRSVYMKPPHTEYISTRWYRPPECLLTNGFYNYKMDIWAAGCVFFEALTNTPLFPGKSELDQIAKIHRVIGTPKQQVIEKLFRHGHNIRLDIRFTPMQGVGISSLSPQVSKSALDLISLLCCYDQDDRINAKQALVHPYFRNIRVAEKYRHNRRSTSTSDVASTWSRDSWRTPQPRASSLELRSDSSISRPYRIKFQEKRSDFRLPQLRGSWVNVSHLPVREPKHLQYRRQRTLHLPPLQPAEN